MLLSKMHFRDCSNSEPAPGLWVTSLCQHCVVVVVVLRLRACVREKPEKDIERHTNSVK